MAYNSFKPTIWSEIVERNFRKNLVLGNLIMDMSDKIATEGKSITLPSFDAVSIKDYTGAITTEEVVDGVQTLLIDKAKYFSVKVDDIDAAQVKGDLLVKLGQRGGYQLADAFDTEVAKIHAKATVKVEATSGTIVQSIYKLGALMTSKNVPTAGRWLVLDPMTHALLLAEVPTISTGENSFNVAKEAFVGRFGGFDIFVSNNIQLDVAKPQCLAGVRESAAYASQIDKVRAMSMEGSFAEKVEGLNSYGVDAIETDLTAHTSDKLAVLSVTLP
ncbi:MAG: P22 phage major capsid protein family protein [Fusobacteriaceae bacterium]